MYWFQCNLRRKLEEKSIPPLTLAVATHLPLRTVNRYVDGKLRRIDADIVGTFAKYLHCSFDDLITLVDASAAPINQSGK